MGRVLPWILALAVGVAALRIDNSDRASPAVSRVVNLLKDMQAELQKEADNDSELYDKLVCWCETNEKEKTKAIEIAKQMISDYTATIEETAAKNAQLTTDVAQLKKEVADNSASLDQATALRTKESGEFQTDEKDAIASIGSLKNAVMTLGKHNEGSSLVQRETLVQLTTMLRRHMKENTAVFAGAVAPHQRQMLMNLLQRPDGMLSLLQESQGAPAYAPASGEIFGILKQMKESFETNLEGSRKDEAESAKSFGELKSAKQMEIKAATEKAFNKEAEAAVALKKNAEAKEGLKNTQKALESDTAFLASLKQKCATMDEDWEVRSKTRGEEIAAVSETIAFLTEDDAKDLFSKSLGLLQVHAQSQRNAAQRAQAVQFLADAGKKLNSPRMSYLATRMRYDPFGKLRDGIDNMVGALGKEKTDEIHHKDDCVSDLNQNDKQTTERNEHKSDVEQEINDLNAEEDALTVDEKRLLQEISDAQIEMKKASENREKENKEFQQTVADQRATQEILKKAMDRLGEFYNKKAALMQNKQEPVPGAAVEAMPAGFGEYKKSGGGGAMALIENVIADSAKVEKDAIAAEQDAQTAYEAFIKDTNAEIKAKQAGIVADEENLARDVVQEANDETDKRGTISDLLNLESMSGAIHQSCDFTLDNFETRQEARDGEVEALKQAKAIFSGAGFGR